LDMDELCPWLNERSGQFASPLAPPLHSDESWNLKVEVGRGPEGSHPREAEVHERRADQGLSRQLVRRVDRIVDWVKA
jgi:hypothetical protein